MSNKILMRSIFLVFGLVVVGAVIYATMHVNLQDTAESDVSTKTFFQQFVIAGGPIVWFVLLPMSLVMVYFIVEQLFMLRRRSLLPEGIGRDVANTIRRRGIEQLETHLSGHNDLVRVATVKAVTHGRGDWFRMRNTLSESLQDQAWGLLRKIEWLNIIGNVSPMVGLFGTVFGMIKIFNAIVTAGGQPQPSQLAEGISVALVTTFWGLLIAIPSVTLYGFFKNRIETMISDAVIESEEIVPEIRRSLKRLIEQKNKKQPIREIRTAGTDASRQPASY